MAATCDAVLSTVLKASNHLAWPEGAVHRANSSTHETAMGDGAWGEGMRFARDNRRKRPAADCRARRLRRSLEGEVANVSAGFGQPLSSHVDTCFHALCRVTDSTLAKRVRKSSFSERGANSTSARGVGAFTARFLCFFASLEVLGVAAFDGGGAFSWLTPVGMASWRELLASWLLLSSSLWLLSSVDRAGFLRSLLLLPRCMKCGVTRRNLPWLHIPAALPARASGWMGTFTKPEADALGT